MKNLLAKMNCYLGCWSEPSILLARIALAVVFIKAGWGKFGRLDQVTGFFESLGIPFAGLQAPMVASLELLLGIFILIGFLTRMSSVVLSIIMVVALFTAHAGEIDGIGALLSQAPFLYILLFLILMGKGAGKYSVDHRMKW
tara:strand:- start:938 stop:1363 length:426 start_codon:yes stop_codon:yes gene_type:complete